jgi:hypothetical protein
MEYKEYWTVYLCGKTIRIAKNNFTHGIERLRVTKRIHGIGRTRRITSGADCGAHVE